MKGKNTNLQKIINNEESYQYKLQKSLLKSFF